MLVLRRAFLEFSDRCGNVSHVWQDPLPSPPGHDVLAGGRLEAATHAAARDNADTLLCQDKAVASSARPRSGNMPGADSCRGSHADSVMDGMGAGDVHRTLLGRLAALGTEATQVAVGHRAPCVGPIICMARALRKRLGTTISDMDAVEVLTPFTCMVSMFLLLIRLRLH